MIIVELILIIVLVILGITDLIFNFLPFNINEDLILCLISTIIYGVMRLSSDITTIEDKLNNKIIQITTRLDEIIKKKHQNKVLSDPILYNSSDNTSNRVYFIIDKIYTDKELEGFKHFLNIEFPSLNYSIISSLIININDKDAEKQIIDLYSSNRTNLEQYISENSKVICMGRAIFSITRSDDLYWFDFYDYISDMNYFYSPDLKCNIFPMDSYLSFKGRTNFERKFAVEQIQRCIVSNARPRIKPLTIHDVSNTNKFFDDFQDIKIMAIDTETNSLDWFVAEIGCVTIAFNNHEGYYLRWKDINIDRFNTFLKDKKLILQNGKYDCKVFITNGVKRDNLYIFFDTWQGQHIWKEDNKHNSLKAGAWRFTHYGGYDRSLDEYKAKYKIKNYLEIPERLLKKYATYDSILTFQIYEKLNKIYDKMDIVAPPKTEWTLKRYAYDIVMPSINTYLDMELEGIRVDINVLKKNADKVKSQIKRIKSTIYKSFNIKEKELDLDSPQKLGKFLREIGWKISEVGKNKIPSTNDECLQEWKKQGHKEAELLLKLKERQKLMSSYLGEKIGAKGKPTGMWQHLKYHSDCDEWRIHPTFHVMVCSSGRNRSSRPNAQNFPSHGDKSKIVREIFKTKDDNQLWLSSDYSGLQLRIGAILSGDEVMKDIFLNKGGDMHSITGFGVFAEGKWFVDDSNSEKLVPILSDENIENTNVREMTLSDFIKMKEYNDTISNARSDSKAINFGFQFGASASTFNSTTLSNAWTYEQCKEYIEVNGLENELRIQLKKMLDPNNPRSKTIDKNRSKEDKIKIGHYLVVSQNIRTLFFKKYKGLNTYLFNTMKLAINNGYVRSIYGAFRRLPRLTFLRDNFSLEKAKTFDELKKAYFYISQLDKSIRNGYDLGDINNFLNISLNTGTQNIEVVVVNRWLTKVNNEKKRLGLKSLAFANIHDAGEFLTYRSEWEEFLDMVKYYGEEDYPEFNGIPLTVESNLADPLKNQLWDRGNKV